MDGVWSPQEEMELRHTFAYAAIGSKDTVREALDEFVELTHADELMIASHVYDHAARLRSYEIVAELHREKS
jgi:alkanesulfonate monooxygenase SsuD/methylene tetrahydromethanopterin reductase-like flavin-dependent oxidoreductase (luciferase family)